jgi:hypothetical protein
VVQQAVASPSAASLLVVEAVGKLPGALPQAFIQTASQLIGMAVELKVAPLVALAKLQPVACLSGEELVAKHAELIGDAH